MYDEMRSTPCDYTETSSSGWDTDITLTPAAGCDFHWMH